MTRTTQSATETPANLLLILQIADSAFPIGGFAHSNGLESALKWHAVAGEVGFSQFLFDCMIQVKHGSLPFVDRVHDGHDLTEVDWECDAFLNNHVANRASRRQGRALLSTADAVFGVTEFTELQQVIRDEQLPCHLAPMFGRFAAGLGVSRMETDQLFLFMTLRSLVSSSVRLGLIGPFRGQAIQHEFGMRLQAMLAHRDEDELVACQTSPLIDIYQSTHDRVYSRLFQS